MKTTCLFCNSHCSPLDLPGEPKKAAEPGHEVAAVDEPDLGVLVRLEDDLEAAADVPLVHRRHCDDLFESPRHPLLPGNNQDWRRIIEPKLNDIIHNEYSVRIRAANHFKISFRASAGTAD